MVQELAYSIHLGSDKNRSKVAKKVAKGNGSSTTSFSNNAIQNAQQLQFKMHNNYQKLISITYEIMTIKQMIFKLYMVQMIYLKMFKICIKRNFYKHN